MSEQIRNQHLTVEVRPRQTRVAYLIDPAATSFALLDALFEASMGVWGGRLFPIIPVVAGVIEPHFWSLLRKVDPDWIYSYTTLSQDTVDQLLREINPLAMERHADHLFKGDHPHFSPGLRHRLVQVHRVLPYATETRWFRKPSLVTYKTKSGKTDSLIARNFGILRADVLGEPVPEDISQLCADESDDFVSLLTKLSEHQGSLVYPYAASMSRAVVDSGQESYETSYTIFVGDDLDTWVAFWNHIFTLSPASRDTWKAFCVPKTALEDEPTIEALARFLRRYAYRNGNNPPYVHWTSSVMTADELKTLTAPFLGKKLDAIFRYTQRTAWSFPEIPEREKYSFGFRGGGLGAPELFSASAHQIPSSGGLVNVPGLPFQSGTDEHWMQDVRIQYLADYPYYANEDLQYQLPRRGSMTSLFSALPGRIDADGGLSFLTGRRQPLFLKIPDDRDILLTAIGCGRRGTYNGNLSRKELPPIYRKQRSSDKARYCRGVLDLFGGIFAASHTFDTRFWKNIFSYLAGLGGRTATTNSSIVYQTIEKYPERWILDDTLPRDQEIARIEKEIVKLSQRVRVRENEVTLQFLEKSLTAERAEFRQQQSEGEPPEVIDTLNEVAEVRADLLRALQGFVEAKILRQGTNTHCRHCGSKIWQEFSSLQQEFKCVGCGALNHSDVEATWYYRLNTLLRGGIVEYGTIPVIAALAAARGKAKQSFIYSPGLEFYEQYEDRKAAAELDAICLVDGEVWVGEVKTNISEFKPNEMDKLVREAKKMRADKAFVFASEGDQNLLHKRCEEASALKNFPIIHLWPSSWGQTASFHI